MTRDEEKLFCDYAAEQISEEDFRRLHTLLEQDPQLRIAFLEYMNTSSSTIRPNRIPPPPIF